MSAIQTALLAAAGLVLGDFKGDRPAMHQAVVKAINAVDEKTWNGLPLAAQDWFNDAADAVKAKKAPAEFPDYKEETPEPRGRRRSADADEPQERPSVDKLEEGQRVKIVTKRGKTYEGEVVENNKRKEFVAIKGDSGEDEIDYDKVDSLEVFHGTAAAAGATDEDAGPEVGDHVSFENKRGKKFDGVIAKMNDEYLELENGDDCDLDKIVGDITIVKKAGGKQEPEEAPTRRRGAAAAPAPAADGDEKEPRSSNPRGVSVGGRVRELMAADLDLTQDEVGATLKKEGIAFRDTSLRMIYNDCANFIKCLREAKQLKK